MARNMIDVERFIDDGYLVIPDFLDQSECSEMVARAYALVKEFVQDGETRSVFDTQQEDQLKDDYFLESNDKIRPFYEKNAFDKYGRLQVHRLYALNKIGHALHYLDPVFRHVTYSTRVKLVLRQLGFVAPAVVQSMIIFKNPVVSTEVHPHQDATYLFASPKPVLGLWFALEDATVENGCLWMIPRSHKSGVHRRLRRSLGAAVGQKVAYDGPQPIYNICNFVPVQVTRGSCVLIHGHVVHRSSVNTTTDTPRPAYTFHVAELHQNILSPDNWLLEGPDAPFQDINKVVRKIAPAESSEAPASPPPGCYDETEDGISSTNQL